MADNAATAAAAPGMPQLDPSSFPNQIFWLVVTLVAIYFILSRVALPRIASVLAERQGTLTNDLAAAEDLKRKAVEAEAAYNKALADARNEANKIAEETRAAIQADLNDAIARADAEIAAKATESEARIGEIRAGAVQSIEEVARAIAGDIAAAVAPGTSIDADAVAAAVSARVKG
ncbi:F0F1 ATP synthase subunit B' [Roseicyclus mahoneyensis]|jgi:F-type H+-transporting ATPase subunit b|uniref:ATP synthase subunit b n=1 Tax=Roseicyclus mahoneyensis TaxID=164332 RepID=A0A316GIB5_9RHOB|nr:F0F1 ATP synthase subunit B' [Roseicyclus mahoneyensis]PWK60837.1 F-type H+-transporting ATPase subunit b [Roseicyclus mahoneyensis]